MRNFCKFVSHLLPVGIALGVLVASVDAKVANGTKAKKNTNFISVSGGVKVSRGDGYFKCDQLICPETTERCHVSKRMSMMDPHSYEVINICFDKNDEVLNRLKQKERYTGGHIALVLDVCGNGDSLMQNDNAIVIKNCQQIAQILRRGIKELNVAMDEFDDGMDELTEGLSDML